MGIVFALFGYGLSFWFASPKMELAESSKDWPSVTGSIITSEVINSRRSKGTMYSPKVAYSYIVEGKHLENSALDNGAAWSSSNSSTSYAIVNKYSQGSRVPVYYNPQNPSQSVLETGIPSSLTWAYRGGLVALVLGLLVVLSGVKSLLRSVPPPFPLRDTGRSENAGDPPQMS